MEMKAGTYGARFFVDYNIVNVAADWDARNAAGVESLRKYIEAIVVYISRYCSSDQKQELMLRLCSLMSL